MALPTDLLIPPSRLVRQQAVEIDRFGCDVSFGGETLRTITEQVASDKTGIRAITGLDTNFQALEAATDSRVFAISPAYFAPYRTLAAPTERDVLVWMGMNYYLSHVTWENEGADTLLTLCYGYRLITQPTEAVPV